MTHILPLSLSFDRVWASAGLISAGAHRVFSSLCTKFYPAAGRISAASPKTEKSLDFWTHLDTINVISRSAGGQHNHDRGAARQEYPLSIRQTPGWGKGPPPKRPGPVWGRIAGPPENIRRTVTQVESCHDGADFPPYSHDCVMAVFFVCGGLWETLCRGG